MKNKRKLTSDLFQYEDLHEASHNNVQLALVDMAGNAITGFVHCKDYFQDLFFSFFHSKKSISQYGFYWDKHENKRLKNKKNIYIVMRKHKKNNLESLVDLSDIFIDVKLFFDEVDPNFAPLSIDFIDDNIFLKYPVRKFKYPAITSIIMYLCRASLGYNGNYLTIEEYIENLADNALTYSSQDKSYLLLNKELTNLKQSKYSHFTNKTIHNDSGFVNFLRTQNKENAKNK